MAIAGFQKRNWYRENRWNVKTVKLQNVLHSTQKIRENESVLIKLQKHIFNLSANL